MQLRPKKRVRCAPILRQLSVRNTLLPAGGDLPRPRPVRRGEKRANHPPFRKPASRVCLTHAAGRSHSNHQRRPADHIRARLRAPRRSMMRSTLRPSTACTPCSLSARSRPGSSRSRSTARPARAPARRPAPSRANRPRSASARAIGTSRRA